jgi:hypothetical protein
MSLIYSEVHTDKEMIEYLLDCTMATIEEMVTKASMPMYEFRRQCYIAQKAFDYLGRDYTFSSRGLYIAKSEKILEHYTHCRVEFMENKRRKHEENLGKS